MTTQPAARLEVLRRDPVGAPRRTPLLFVHGAWHGAWCWDEHFLPFFAEHGYTSAALSLQDESYRAYLDILGLSLPRPARVSQPMLVLGGQQDAVFSPQEVAGTARAYRCDPVLFPEMAHDMMLDPGWEAVAARILSWLESLSAGGTETA